MSHGIMDLDRLAVGYTDLYGKAWHDHPNCEHFNGPVTLEQAEKVFDYEVEKVPVVLQGTDIPIPGNYALIRKDDGEITIVYPTVGERYVVIQNSELLIWIEAGLLIPYKDQVSIESVGTLSNGQTSFANLHLLEHGVPGDNSKTVTRLMYSNSFGGKSYMACAHTTRVVCANTLRIATAQGASNATLKKFRHTKNAAEKIENHLIELSGVVQASQEHFVQLDHLATQKADSRVVENFFDYFLPIPKDDNSEPKEGHALTRRTNQREAILELFEDKDDLQGGIARTKYALLQSVTDWADHKATVHKGTDMMDRYWDGIYGTKDKLKQSAFDAMLAMN